MCQIHTLQDLTVCQWTCFHSWIWADCSSFTHFLQIKVYCHSCVWEQLGTHAGKNIQGCRPCGFRTFGCAEEPVTLPAVHNISHISPMCLVYKPLTGTAIAAEGFGEGAPPPAVFFLQSDVPGTWPSLPLLPVACSGLISKGILNTKSSPGQAWPKGQSAEPERGTTRVRLLPLLFFVIFCKKMELIFVHICFADLFHE